MKKKVIKIILLLAFISVFRYIGLYICIDNGNLQLLKVMSFCNPLINAEPITTYIPFQPISDAAPFGRPPLAYACSDFWRKTTNNYEIETIEILLKNGADPNIDKPMEWCLRHGGKNRYKIAKLLKEKGAKFFEDRHFILYLIDHKCFDDDEETLKYKYELFLEWMNKFHTNNEYDFYIAYYAVYGNSLNEFMYMMENYDIDINSKEEAGFYILRPAAQNRNVEFFKLLISYGANVDFITKDGLTIENFITDKRYDEQLINRKYETINYDIEKAEMLKMVNDVRAKKIN